MLFNSVPFAVFLPCVFLLYWLVFPRSLRLQNLFVLAASYFFYAWWGWRFLALIVLSSATDYAVGLALSASDDTGRRRKLLGISLTVNLGCWTPHPAGARRASIWASPRPTTPRSTTATSICSTRPWCRRCSSS